MHSPDLPQHSSLIRDAALVRECLSDIVRVLQEMDRERCGRLGVSVSHSHALLVLLEEGPLTVSRLGERLCLERSTASRLSKGLLQKGYIRKRTPASDERKVILQVTEQGMRLARRILNDLSDGYVDLLLGLDAEARSHLPGVLASLNLALKRLTAG